MADVYWVFYDSFAKIQSNPFTTAEAQTSILKMRPQDVERFLIWTSGWQNWQQLRTYLESDQKNFVSTFTVPVSKTDEQTAREVLETTQTQTAYVIDNTKIPAKSKSHKKEDTQSFSSIHLKEESISRIIKQDQLEQAKESSFDGDEITWSNIKKPDLDFSKISKTPMSKREIRHELKIEILLISQKGKTFRSRSKNISLSGSLLEDTIPFDYYDSTIDVVVINTQTKDPQKARVKLQANVISASGGLSQRIHYCNLSDLQKKSLQVLLEEYIDLKKIAKAG